MLLTLLLFAGSAAAIYFACELFVNGVEWVGRRLHLDATATGTVLAAFGTALPESAVTLAAVVFGKTPEQRDIGVGAALGGPLVLATLAYAMVGIVLLVEAKRRGRGTEVKADGKRLSRDQAWFLAIFAVKVGLGMLAFPGKRWVGLLFLAAYAVYLWRELIGRPKEEEEGEELEPLKLRPKDAEPSLGWSLLQTLGALVVIAIASHFFVKQVEALGETFHIAPHVVALLLSPVATELPEVMNAIIWVRQGRERLALANVSGSMMIQATIPSALGILFTPWLFDDILMVAALCTAIPMIWLWWSFRHGKVRGTVLLPPLIAYLAFGVYLVVHTWFR